MDCRRLKVSTALYVYEGQGGFILFHRLFCKGGKCTLFTAATFCILCLFRVMNMHWAESETLLLWSAVDAWWLWCPVRHR